ncbi:uncharacterized protein E0L32_007938 [Thyridium curvatum]|uniref:Glycine cleavage system P protein n=1 Tax=Thyridium curvatum TaxID=1093900 RepID=A0A507AUA2_9PEZI|nr:uncharacterized protein E0L32_007938 [Thyridium curvatum]TPX11077.1 hypothetical protein E0L32_007938 [Thyridium curvatum]
MSTTARVASRHLGRMARVPHARTVPMSARALTAQPWVCRSCARGAVYTSSRTLASSSRHLNSLKDPYPALDTFPRRHIGPDDQSTEEMLAALAPAVKSLDELVSQVIPPNVKSDRKLFPKPRTSETDPIERAITEALPEKEVLKQGEHAASLNKVLKNFIGAGYYEAVTPDVIERNVLKNPAFYTSYTPYQPEISQGRLECLLNFQTIVSDLTGLPVANASLLDEGTAAAEAMTLSMNMLSSSRAKRKGKTFVVSHLLHPQTISVLHGRASGFGINVQKMDVTASDFKDHVEKLGDDLVGVMVQYPNTEGGVENFRDLAKIVHDKGALLSCATDLMALTVLTPPGEWGADIAFGNAQRFGVPLGYGGPHAAFFAVGDKYKRKMPGRLIGMSKDRLGNRALRLALQTREQHIRREKATSNVCTAQALLANINALYAIYHGPEGLKAIAEKIIRGARAIQTAAEELGYETRTESAAQDGRVVFDTVVIKAPGQAQALQAAAVENGCNLRVFDQDRIGISIDEATTAEHLRALIRILASGKSGSSVVGNEAAKLEELLSKVEGPVEIPEGFRRTSSYLTHPVFNTHHSETEILRYIHHLQSKDLSLVHSMIPLGSCTMKLNGTVEMSLITLPGFSKLHPFAPAEQTEGYQKLLASLSDQLADITGMDAVSLQPNSGAQGEFAGLRTIRRYLESKGETNRDICLIPVSAHGTNPASAAMAGMRVVPIKCDTKTGNLDLQDLEAKCEQHAAQIGAMMITYPSTFGVFEPEIKKVCEIVHKYGGQVYLDGANLNAQIGLCSPGEVGADVCHLNLHKTFCIPHGGGGPGAGPICVKQHLAEHLPPTEVQPGEANPPISSAPYGSASILPISWAYNLLMGSDGLKKASQITLLNANYLLSRLRPHYDIVYTNEHGRCAHEFILDVRPFRETAGVEAIDIAKRLQDYGFHAPTMSWPVANTLMIEPTESESKEELDRFVDALVVIRQEIREVEEGKVPRTANVLKNAPHPVDDIVLGDEGGKWERCYSREKAAFPLPWLREKKFWPSVGRVDDSKFALWGFFFGVIFVQY